MLYAEKPNDVAIAREIGTYPELPDLTDEPGQDPDFWCTGQFTNLPDGVHDMRTFHGPKGTVVMALGDGEICHYRDRYFGEGSDNGELIYKVVWRPSLSTWQRTV